MPRVCPHSGAALAFWGRLDNRAELITQLRYELLDQHRYANLSDILPGDPIRRALRLGKAATLERRSPAYRPTFLAAWSQRWPHHLLKPVVVERVPQFFKTRLQARGQDEVGQLVQLERWLDAGRRD